MFFHFRQPKEQIHKQKEDHEEAINLLQRQLDASEMDNIRLQREIQHLQRTSKAESSDVSSPHEFYPISSHPSEERQEGEVCEKFIVFCLSSSFLIMSCNLVTFVKQPLTSWSEQFDQLSGQLSLGKGIPMLRFIFFTI